MEERIMPKHIAIIMDGNRRWAKQRNLPVKLGHKQGAETLKKVVRYANKIGIKYVTVYAFSTENWKRSEEEVSALMNLLETYLDDFAKEADTENIVIRVLGNMTQLSESLQESIAKTIKRTENNTGTIFNIALNYGGRDEITNAAKNLAKDVKDGKVELENISEELFAKYLYTKDDPDPDLLIRTSGELRLSGFLPWQSTYSEFLFLDKLWPDFSNEDLDNAIDVFSKRNRKFGAK
ncbi:MAG: isoprenyl transferase [Clostridia bacterium]|nr:isoprenyl transferase [Clostridia bacterium]